MEYYILDKHAGEYAIFWKPRKQGITKDFREAGIYTEQEVAEHRDNKDLFFAPVGLIDIETDATVAIRQAAIHFKVLEQSA